MKCTCVSCPECRGTGTVWFSFSGEYLGSSRYDDMDDLDICPECEGSGVVEMCDYCQDELDNEDYD